ncbi:hypothetical protein [Flagellimonas sp.]|uniref:hypothetical protein n=1 Tax=Flagellimonas sp. TaxID=2058762 RepID=UPI003BAF535A
MKQVFLLLIAVLVSNCGAGKRVSTVNEVFETLRRSANKSKCGIYPESFYSNRKGLYPEMDFLNINQDTIYVLQEYDIETGEHKESIWNKVSKLEYTSFKGSTKKSLTPLFESKYYKALNNWNKNGLDDTSEDFGTNDIIAYRIAIFQNEAKIDCMVF